MQFSKRGDHKKYWIYFEKAWKKPNYAKTDPENPENENKFLLDTLLWQVELRWKKVLNRRVDGIVGMAEKIAKAILKMDQ